MQKARYTSIRVGLTTDPASYLVEVPWEAARLRAEVLIAAFLDDITSLSEAHLLRPFRRALVVLGPPTVGLEFSNVAKNSTLVLCCFTDVVRAMFPDAAVVDDDTPGATPKAKLKHGASQLVAESNGLLISHIGVTKFIAPLRTLCPGAGLERNLAWLSEIHPHRAHCHRCRRRRAAWE